MRLKQDKAKLSLANLQLTLENLLSLNLILNNDPWIWINTSKTL